MKKLLIAAAMCLMVGLVRAADNEQRSNRSIPEGPSQSLASADYGGVHVSTVSLSASLRRAFIGKGVFHGVIMTTPTTVNEYVDIFDSSSTTTGLSGAIGSYPQSNTILPIARIYNSTGTAQMPNQYQAVVGLKYPLRVENGLVYQYQVNTLHLLSVLYTKDGDQ